MEYDKDVKELQDYVRMMLKHPEFSSADTAEFFMLMHCEIMLTWLRKFREERGDIDGNVKTN